MSSAEKPQITAICRYPVKGLSPQSLSEVRVKPGGTLPLDRAYAIENGPGRFDPASPRHLPKINFLMLMRDERLATLDTEFDADTHELIIKRDGKRVAKGQLTTPVGRQLIEQFLAAYMKDSLRGAPRVVSATGHSFSDVADKCIHIVNLNSIRDLSRMLNCDIDPMRFRANVYIDGLEPWVEFDWLDQEIQIGGDVKAQVFARTQRCDATNVDPKTGARDLAIPAALLRGKGHSDLGIYANIMSEGEIRLGDDITG